MSLESEQTALNTSEKAVQQNITQTTLGSVRQKLQDPINVTDFSNKMPWAFKLDWVFRDRQLPNFRNYLLHS
jgi:hypothetical protein